MSHTYSSSELVGADKQAEYVTNEAILGPLFMPKSWTARGGKQPTCAPFIKKA